MDVSYEADIPQTPAAVGRAAFTVVREALTNAARHAPGAEVSVRIARTPTRWGSRCLTARRPRGHAAARRGGPRALRYPRPGDIAWREIVDGAENGGFAVRALLPLESTLSTEAGD